MQMQINKTKNNITFKIKPFQLKTPETIKLTRNEEKITTKDKNNNIVLHLEITQQIIDNCKLRTLIIKRIQIYTFVADQ